MSNQAINKDATPQDIKNLFDSSFTETTTKLPASYGNCVSKTITSAYLTLRDAFSPGYKANFIFEHLVSTAHESKKALLEHHFAVYKIGQSAATTPSTIERISTYVNSFFKDKNPPTPIYNEHLSTSEKSPEPPLPVGLDRRASEAIRSLGLNDPKTIHTLLTSYDLDDLPDLTQKISQSARLAYAATPDSIRKQYIIAAIPDLAKHHPTHFKFCLDLIANHSEAQADLQTLLGKISNPDFPISVALSIKLPENNDLYPDDNTAFNTLAKDITVPQKNAILPILPDLDISDLKKFKENLLFLLQKTQKIPAEINTKIALSEYLIKTHLGGMEYTPGTSTNFNTFLTNFTFLTEEGLSDDKRSRYEKLSTIDPAIKNGILNLFLQNTQNLEGSQDDKPTGGNRNLIWLAITGLVPELRTPITDFKQAIWELSFPSKTFPSEATDQNFLALYFNNLPEPAEIELKPGDLPPLQLLQLLAYNIKTPLAIDWIDNPPSKVILENFSSPPEMSPCQDLAQATKAFKGNYSEWATGSTLTVLDNKSVSIARENREKKSTEVIVDDDQSIQLAKARDSQANTAISTIAETLQTGSYTENQINTTLFALSTNGTGIFLTPFNLLGIKISDETPYTFDIKKTNTTDLQIDISFKTTSDNTEDQENTPSASGQMTILIKPDGSHQVTALSVQKEPEAQQLPSS